MLGNYHGCDRFLHRFPWLPWSQHPLEPYQPITLVPFSFQLGDYPANSWIINLEGLMFGQVQTSDCGEKWVTGWVISTADCVLATNADVQEGGCCVVESALRMDCPVGSMASRLPPPYATNSFTYFWQVHKFVVRIGIHHTEAQRDFKEHLQIPGVVCQPLFCMGHNAVFQTTLV